MAPTAREWGRGQGFEPVQGAAWLEGAGELQQLGFGRDGPAHQVTEARGRNQRGAIERAAKALPCGHDVAKAIHPGTEEVRHGVPFLAPARLLG
jgi:hypothetical protein